MEAKDFLLYNCHGISGKVVKKWDYKTDNKESFEQKVSIICLFCFANRKEHKIPISIFFQNLQLYHELEDWQYMYAGFYRKISFKLSPGLSKQELSQHK